MKTYETPNLTLIVMKEDVIRTSNVTTDTDPGKNDIFYSEFGA